MHLTRDLLYEIASDSENKKYDDLRRAVLDRNPALVAFDIVRNGDDITLAFALRREAAKADFRLLGNKHDYYRMAMGVSLAETFQVLAQSDPNIHPIEVAKNDQEIVLRLSYAWPKGMEPAEPQAVSPPAPPPQAPPVEPPAAEQPVRRPSRRERTVAQPPSDAEPDRNSKYFVPAKPIPGEVPPESGAATAAAPVEPQPAATAPAAPETPPAPVAPARRRPAPPPEAESEVALPVPSEPPPAASGPQVHEEPAAESRPPAPEPSREEKAERAFGEADEEGTLAAWEGFLAAFPDAPQGAEARKRVDALKAEAAYEKAKAKDDAASYRTFLERFGASVRAAEVEARLKALEFREERAKAENAARTEADRRRREAYDEARRMNDATAYRVFLAAYPDAPEAPEIRQYQQVAEADDAAFAEASSSAAGLEAYVAMRPKGRHADDARRRLTALRNAGSEAAYRDAEARGTPEAFESYLKAWPKSPKTAEARAALEAFRKAAKADGSAPPQLPETTLVAPYVGTLPVINGRANDAAWQNAPTAEVPVAGGPRTLRVKAVHDGRTLQLLVQWSDASRDAQYRPWIWDATKKTYRQSAQVDDALAVALYRGRPPTDACMLQGQNQEADFWVWRAFWSEISGLADDETFRVSRDRIPKANPYSTQGGAGQVWIREDPDGGSPGWSFFIPVDYQAPTVPSYRRAEGSGSRADVRAAGLWEGGTWTVEFARALDTRHGDDMPLKERNAYAISFAVYDKSEKGRHAASGLVRLEIRGR